METRKKEIIITVIIIAILILGIGIFMSTPIFAVTQTKYSVSLELGEKLNTNPAEYLEGNEFFVPFSIVNIAKVDEEKVGNYSMYIYHGLKKYVCNVQIRDMTKPEISCNTRQITLKAGDTLSIDDIEFTVEDYSDVESTFLYYEIQEISVGENPLDVYSAKYEGPDTVEIGATEYTFEQSGTYKLYLRVEDEQGNYTDKQIKVTVESDPVIEAPTDIYVVAGNHFSVAEYVKAWDFHDGEYAVEDVEVGDEKVDVDTIGEYEVPISITDSYGQTATSALTVHVCTQENIYELLQAGKIDVETMAVVGSFSEYDMGYYKDADIDTIYEETLPCLVYVRNLARSSGGCGFILDIDEEYVTIATNQHVIAKEDSPRIIFFDNTSAVGSVVAANVEQDIAFVRVPVAAVEVEKLKTVHIDESYWNALRKKDAISLYYSCLDRNADIWRTADGTMKIKASMVNWEKDDDVEKEFYACIVDLEIVHGSSGSAIFDAQGRLIAMATGYISSENDFGTYMIYVTKPLKEILSYYEEVFGEKVQY